MVYFIKITKNFNLDYYKFIHGEKNEDDLIKKIKIILAESFDDPRALEYRNDRIVEGAALKAVMDWFNETYNIVITEADRSKKMRITIKNLGRNLAEILATVSEREESEASRGIRK